MSQLGSNALLRYRGVEAGDLQNFFTKLDGYVAGIDPYSIC
jgi:hypothetical protein